MASLSITEEARRRKSCLDKWNHDLDSLVSASNAYMTSTAQLVRACPLNDTAPLQAMGVVDDGSVASVTDVFNRIGDRIFEIGLVEEQARLSKSSLVRRRNRMADVTSVSRLPDEVLALVFEYIAKTKDTIAPIRITGLKRVAVLRPEIIFTWVSQQWRDIALNLPRLWRDINFYNEKPPFIRTQKYLIRSQELPLRVSFNAHYMLSSQYLNHDVYLLTAIGTVLPAFKRWGSISVTAENIKQLRRCFYAMHHSEQGDKAKHIKSLRLSLPTPPGTPVKVLFNEDLSRFWKGAIEELQALALTGVTIPWDWTGWYSRLRHFKLAYTDASSDLLTVPFVEAVWPLKSQFLAVLKACPTLETLDLVELRFRDQAQILHATPPLGPITSVPEEHAEHGVSLPRLHKLSIKTRHCPTLQHLLDMIVANNLEDFHCDTRGGAGSQDPENIASFLVRISQVQAAPLRRLSLAYDHNPNLYRNGPGLLDLLQRVPGLEELVIQEGEISDEFLKALTPPSALETRSIILPKLRALKLWKTPEPVSPINVVNLVRGRAAAAASSTEEGPNSYVPLRILHVRRPQTDLSPHRTLPGTVGPPIDVAALQDGIKRMQDLTEVLDELGWNDSTWKKGEPVDPKQAVGGTEAPPSGQFIRLGDLSTLGALIGGGTTSHTGVVD
ncbi:hypothetical protein M407DRAFT_25039 [Tulasnella calospora MUT 4182]|uniref:Uncharacterized protein n=1 Tax=Tulasnella calospora MUT 4182 TaxID=1051891 RepID=A0A0C3Q7P2_9AGAM|nr:hypothetical protein M407DRAFT_25039 [Tulasnella calospora MUT 4182]